MMINMSQVLTLCLVTDTDWIHWQLWATDISCHSLQYQYMLLGYQHQLRSRSEKNSSVKAEGNWYTLVPPSLPLYFWCN